MTWDQAKPHADHVRSHGIQQFLQIYRRLKDRRRDSLYWGDEVEFSLVTFDDEKKRVRLTARATEVLNQLQMLEQAAIKAGFDPESSWKPEYARYMLEATPGKPYGASILSMLTVEWNMSER